MTIALIVAAGSGERLGAGRPKALVELAGRPMLQWSIEALSRTAGVERVVVAMPAGEIAPAGVLSVTGGSSRSHSVALALAAAGDGDTVLVHDAARPLIDAATASSVIEALLRDPSAHAAIAACAVTDTIKRTGPDGAVTQTLDRSQLWSVQTPQVFRRDALERALSAPAGELAGATDDAQLIERAGGRVIVVPCSPENLKVTTPVDLRLAQMLLERRAAAVR